MKRLFFLAGEQSGDQLGAWYVKKHLANSPEKYYLEAIGGDALQAVGVKLFDRIENLNVVGIVEIIRHIPRLLASINRVVDYLIEQKFDEVVLIDFPGFNMRVAKKLKQKNPAIKITYLSPPQLWCARKGRLSNLKKYTDDVIVIFPFEVAWYREHGMQVVWQGNPVYDRLKSYLSHDVAQTATVALLPGSRTQEIKKLLPIMGEVVKRLHERFPEIKFVFPRPASLSPAFIHEQLVLVGLSSLVTVVEGDDEKNRVLQQCCFAITKPGTVTLELALLKVPALVMYKTSPITYFIAKRFAYITQMALPNLLMPTPVYPEFIQERCTPVLLLQEAEKIYKSFRGNADFYRQQKAKLVAVQNLFSHEMAKI